ncbi:MAG: hypothetical protein Q8N17_26030 [Burkholderiaceae bacterium]|nr:hypothetical protein [Burkholderiaceae bacterium]
MNLLQLATRLHRESGRSGNGPTTIVGASKDHLRLFDWINDAWTELQNRPLDWRWMRERVTATLTTGISSYSGASLSAADFGKWRPYSKEYTPKCYETATPENYWRLGWMTLEQFRDHYVDSSPPAGRPLDWSIDDDGSLLIGPEPDAAYGIKSEYLHAPTELVADTDEPDFQTSHHMLLVWRALIEVGTFDNAADVLARASANFARAENSLLAEYARPLHFGGPLA